MACGCQHDQAQGASVFGSSYAFFAAFFIHFICNINRLRIFYYYEAQHLSTLKCAFFD
jgi:hypothetical protein